MAYTAIAGFLSLIVVFPLVWVIATSLKDRRQIIQNPLGLPEVYQWSNYAEAWQDGNFGIYFINSILVVIPTALGVVVLSLLAAYAFAMFKFRGKNALFTFFLIGLTVPLGILIIPIFYQMVSLKLVNNLWALILPQTAVGLPFAILLLRGFIQELPKEVLDAGRIDGCSNWGILRFIVMPLSRPALLSVMIFNIVWVWNQFLLPVVLIQKASARTLPQGLSVFMGRYGADFGLLMAGATISFVPVVIVYVIFQRHFIKGIAAGALSGI
ncbi:MAG: carbohydrate ABC transporter permease [Chloroflexi bacterium]|nr:carbohydrate ABC transporter permease [Chloroflexota bacterium]